MAQKSRAFCLPWITLILNAVHCVHHQKLISIGIEAYCWQSWTAGGLVLRKIAARVQNHCDSFCGVSVQAIVLYSCTGCKYWELQDGIVKVRFGKKVESQVDDTWKATYLNMSSSSFGKQVCWAEIRSTLTCHIWSRQWQATATDSLSCMKQDRLAGHTGQLPTICQSSLPAKLFVFCCCGGHYPAPFLLGPESHLLKSWAVGFGVKHRCDPCVR